jgi:membrane-bound lytic murein transglycosylase MltF
MRRHPLLRFVLAGLLASAVRPVAAQPVSSKDAGKAREKHQLPLPDDTWTGDFDGMRKRRMVRVLAVYNQTNFFLDKGTPRGITYDALKMFEEHINKKYKTKKLPIHVVFIPARREAIFDLLLSGKGDIAAAGLTITPERLKESDFSAPILQNVYEIVVSGPASEPLVSVDDLSGREVFVRESSIFHESLQALNAGLAQRGKALVRLRLAPDNLEDEDLLEMLNAGLVNYVVVNDYLARFWARVLPKIRLNEDVRLRHDADIGWAMRRGSPLLKAELDAFIAKHPEGSTTRAVLFQKYLKHTKFVKSAASQAERSKFERTVQFFRQYSDKYEMDYLLMAAQGYQESRLDQNARSPVGAIGVMQVMPSTGKEMRVGDISKLDANIHAGVKYMRFMIDQYFADEPMDPLNKGLFAFASYNAGPGRVQSLRREAAKKGLDPNQWFHNVEIVASQRVGRETVTYVANIYKYYIAYKLITEDQQDRQKAREEVKSSK